MKILTKENCPACIKVKEYLQRKKIAFEECNVEEDKWFCVWAILARDMGAKRTVPCLIDEETKLVGSDRILAHLGVKAVEATTVDKEACDSCQ